MVGMLTTIAKMNKCLLNIMKKKAIKTKLLVTITFPVYLITTHIVNQILERNGI